MKIILKLAIILNLYFLEKKIFAQKNLSLTKKDSISLDKLIKYYPQIKKYTNTELYFNDGTYIKIKNNPAMNSFQELLDNPSVLDQFIYEYPKGKSLEKNLFHNDPGRIRNEEFFKHIYGNTAEEVKKNLVEITWCPKLINQKIAITKINNIDKQLIKVSNELDKHPEYKKYMSNIGGTFKWRFINGTNRLSMHSFGMTIDINVKYSNYWQWDCSCKNEELKLGYKNNIHFEIIEIFEKYGFIWGGKWYHYDTMHFEYRPELLD